MKNIYNFAEADQSMLDLLGGKGANLAQMTKMGLPVPFGFTITTGVCNYYLEHTNFPAGFDHELQENLEILEHKMGKTFGNRENPLLVSVRSGAKVSMPGMMDTILNLGLNDETVQGLIEKTGNPRFSYDSYRRFVMMFSNVVLNIPHHEFEHFIHEKKEALGVTLDTDLSADDWKELVSTFKAYVLEKTGQPFPENPRDQLAMAILAVFQSWNNPRAIKYREMNEISHKMGTAVTVQSMVFGNMGEESGTGVAFTRNPSTGEREFYGEFLTNAQGEDVVAGIRTPRKIQEMADVLPEVYEELLRVKDILESHYRDMQDIEFTIENRQLYFLQTRNGKRTAKADIKIAVDMVNEGVLTKEEAILRVDAKNLNNLLHPSVDPSAQKTVLATGLPASPGAASGKIVFEANEAHMLAEEHGEAVILVRKETSPEDFHGMVSAQGVLTATGGMTSHAAVVARGIGKPCIAGCKALDIDEHAKTLKVAGEIFHEGDIITMDGGTGEVMKGAVPTIPASLSDEFSILMEWADEFRRLHVRTNADTYDDAMQARKFGAEGIGLCRTEHMFFETDRIFYVRQMILSSNPQERQKALDALLPMQREDFKEIFRAMNGLPVTVRLLDPPLHEFLPREEAKIAELAQEMGYSVEEMKAKVEALHEFNPMLGHRGCRLGVTTPEIYEMQARAIYEAAKIVTEQGITAIVEIEIPLVGHARELEELRRRIEKIAESMGELNFKHSIGTMIELPRACVTADQIAKHADFFSFGTNDLTQMSFGMSRDDAGSFLPIYVEKGIYDTDPTSSLDEEGVGALMKIAVQLGKASNPNLEIGICGEHGGDPASIDFCHRIGLDFVSCSPYRVPIARLAAAQAALRQA